MHVLTKIFIVLVSLLAVLLVPLVVVYAANEDTFKTRWQVAAEEAAAAEAALAAASQRHATELARLEAELGDRQAELQRKQGEVGELQTQIATLRSDLAIARNTSDQIQAKLATLADAAQAGAELTQSLVAEVRELRTSELEAQRRLAETEQSLREMSRELEVAEAARRSLQEEVQRLTEAEASLTEQVETYQARYGDLDGGVRVAELPPAPPDQKITAEILSVNRVGDQTYVELNAGERDGIKEGWEMTVADGGNYVGRIRITFVDLNRSTGVVEFAEGQPPVRTGQQAIIWPGG